MSMDGKRTYSAGADGAGGFAVPVDWAGGADTTPDPVIAEANENARESAEKHMSIPQHFMAYTKLPQSNAIRKQAEKLMDDYKAIAEQSDMAKPSLLSAKRFLTKIRSDLTSFQSRADKGSDNFSKEWQTWGARRLYELSRLPESVTKMIKNMDGIAEFIREDEYNDATITEASIEVDNTLDGIEATLSVGMPHIQKAIEAEREKMIKLQDAIHSEIIRLDIAEKQGLQETDEIPLQQDQLDHDEIKQDQSVASIPDNVPEYRVAIDSSPRVCGNCRFFKGEAGINGECTAYNFTAKANYVCNAWQSTSLTADHTPVRDANMRGASMQNKAVEQADPHPTTQDGRVPGQQFFYNTLEDTPFENVEEINFSDSTENEAEENAALRAQNNDFLPGDVVYSNALRTLARVDSRMKMDNILVYGLKLLNTDGTYWGSGYSYGTDLQPRSAQATKAAFVNGANNRSKWTYKTDEDEMASMIDDTRSIYKSLKEVIDNYNSEGGDRLKNSTTIRPLLNSMESILEKPEWQDRRTGPPRKYYRAVQSACHAVGAAQEILFEADKQVVRIYRTSNGNKASKATMKQIALKAQSDAYRRLEDAFKFVKDSLTLPSATHNMPAPGIEDNSE